MIRTSLADGFKTGSGFIGGFYNNKTIACVWMYIGSQMNFHSIRCIYETSCVFYIPEPLARGYKTHNEFHNTSYWMKIHLRFFLSHELTRNEQITRWNRLFPRIGDGWRRSLLCFDNKFALCSVINTRRRSHFTKVEIKKHQEEHVLM